jgi:hypothetical protein
MYRDEACIKAETSSLGIISNPPPYFDPAKFQQLRYFTALTPEP